MQVLDSEIEKARTDLHAAEQRRLALRRQLAGEEQAPLATDGHGSTAAIDRLAEIDSRAEALRRNLDELLRKYTDEHPDVVGARRVLADLEKQRAAIVETNRRAGASAPVAPASSRQPNLIYQQLRLTLADSEADVAALSARLSALETRYSR